MALKRKVARRAAEPSAAESELAATFPNGAALHLED
jgi:hypothetical protein